MQLHTGPCGVDGTQNLAPVPRVLATRCAATVDPYGLAEFWVEAHWRGITASGVTEFTIWGGEDGSRLLAAGNLPAPTHVLNGTFDMCSFPDYDWEAGQ